MRWTANGRWDLSFSRVAILTIGLAIFGFGDGLIIQSHIGNAPWSVLAQGLSLHTPFSIGECTFIIGFAVLLLWWPLRERPGFGTLANICIISLFIQVAVDICPVIHNNFALSLLMVMGGIAMVGLGSTLYITTGLGPGPRDGLMTALHHRTGVRVARVRLGIEIWLGIIGHLAGSNR